MLEWPELGPSAQITKAQRVRMQQSEREVLVKFAQSKTSMSISSLSIHH